LARLLYWIWLVLAIVSIGREWRRGRRSRPFAVTFVLVWVAIGICWQRGRFCPYWSTIIAASWSACWRCCPSSGSPASITHPRPTT